MNKLSIITGAGTGIGRALAVHLAEERKLKVLGVGRRIDKLMETQEYSPEQIDILAADVGSENGRQQILEAVPENYDVQFLVHNAAVLGPVKPLMEFSIQEWREHMAINVEGPMFLTQKLMPILKGGRILHISSGAAHHGYSGWGAYCTSKAALFSIYEVLREELNQHNILIGSVRPGVVNTPMQDEVRTSSEKVFPMLPRFINLKKENQLIDPQKVAEFLGYLLIDTGNQEFSDKEWDFRDQ